MHTLTKDVYISSVLNPNMRIFDVEMCTEFGTSYNSYVVVGSEKIALIDANHASFTDEWLEKVSRVLAGRTPDYLVLNHTEPDHSGSVDACLTRYPDITLVCSPAAALNIKHISNREDLVIQKVKDGDVIDLGTLTLHFISAPFLHWPDTMFTWIPERKVVFTCDFFGCHFCEPRFFDHRIIYRKEFLAAYEEYYHAIMAPFAPWVRKGLEKLENIDADFMATSHGPILSKGHDLEPCIKKYKEWSRDPRLDRALKISLFYCSSYGNTMKLALSIAEGVQRALPAAKVFVHDLVAADLGYMSAELNDSDAVLIGSPTVNKEALPTVWTLLAHIDAINIVKRPVALFGSYGWSGEAVPNLAERLTSLKTKVFEEKFLVQFVPSENDLKDAVRFGEEFGKSLEQ